jgi:hypothetical protein
MFVRVFSVVIALLASLELASAGPRLLVSGNAVGPVRLGMTASAIEQALAAPLEPFNELVFSSDCYVTQRADKVDPEVQYTIRDGLLTRIHVLRPDRAAVPLDARTQDGIGFGSPVADVKRIYGKDLVIRPDGDIDEKAGASLGHKSKSGKDRRGPQVLWLQVNDRKGGRAIVFETLNGKVVSMQIGVIPYVLQTEVCF